MIRRLFSRGIYAAVSFTLFSVLTFLSMTSCERRDLYVEHETPVKVIVKMDWGNLGEKPSGASIYFYPKDGGAPHVFTTNSVDRAVCYVPSGYYDVLVFNKTPYEYGTLNFYDMDSLQASRSILDDESYSWVTQNDTVDRTVCEPENIVVARYDNFQVRTIADYYTDWDGTETTYKVDNVDEEQYDSLSVKPKKFVMTCYVKVRIHGIQNVSQIRAYLTGMSDGILLGKQTYRSDLSTFAMTSWTKTLDTDMYSWGNITTSFRCFGLPPEYLAAPVDDNNRFIIKFLLWDNSTVLTRAFHVGTRIKEYPDQYELYLNIGLGEFEGDDPIEIPDVDPEGGTRSGFDVTIEDWGETVEVIIPM